MANTYWEKNGKHQEMYDLVKHHIPRTGRAKHPAIELLRVITNCYYDLYCNGGGNCYEFQVMRSLLENTPFLPLSPKQWENFDRSLTTLISIGGYTYTDPENETQSILFSVLETLADWAIVQAFDFIESARIEAEANEKTVRKRYDSLGGIDSTGERDKVTGANLQGLTYSDAVRFELIEDDLATARPLPPLPKQN